MSETVISVVAEELISRDDVLAVLTVFSENLIGFIVVVIIIFACFASICDLLLSRKRYKLIKRYIEDMEEKLNLR